MTHRQRKTRKRGRGGARSKLLLALGIVALTAAVGVLSVAGYVFAVAATAPDLNELKPADKGESSVIFASDGSRLGYVQSDEIRTRIPWSEMTKDVRDAAWEKLMQDERMAAGPDRPFDGMRMMIGGFTPIVDTKA